MVSVRPIKQAGSCLGPLLKPCDGKEYYVGGYLRADGLKYLLYSLF
jgi:hypothetical protein